MVLLFSLMISVWAVALALALALAVLVACSSLGGAQSLRGLQCRKAGRFVSIRRSSSFGTCKGHMV